MFASLRRRLHVGRLPRLCAAGACLLLALNSALNASGQASRPRTVPVVVAATALPAGHRLAASDLRLARWPAPLRPAAAVRDPAGVVGRRLTGPLGAREPVTVNRLLGPGLTAGLPSGLVAAPVPIADPHVVELVRPGDSVEVLASPRPADDPTGSRPSRTSVRTVASAALVLAAFRGDAGDPGEVVLAVPRPTAMTITRDTAANVFTVVIGPP